MNPSKQNRSFEEDERIQPRMTPDTRGEDDTDDTAADQVDPSVLISDEPAATEADTGKVMAIDSNENVTDLELDLLDQATAADDILVDDSILQEPESIAGHDQSLEQLPAPGGLGPFESDPQPAGHYKEEDIIDEGDVVVMESRNTGSTCRYEQLITEALKPEHVAIISVRSRFWRPSWKGSPPDDCRPHSG
jgi:hypothetical protein